MYLWHRGLPAHVFQRGRGKTRRACGPLLEEQNHTFGVLPQFNNQVFQLPAHLVYKKTNKTIKVYTQVEGCSDVEASKGSYHGLQVDLDHLITSMDLPRQVCR